MKISAAQEDYTSLIAITFPCTSFQYYFAYEEIVANISGDELDRLITFLGEEKGDVRITAETETELCFSGRERLTFSPPSLLPPGTNISSPFPLYTYPLSHDVIIGVSSIDEYDTLTVRVGSAEVHLQNKLYLETYETIKQLDKICNERRSGTVQFGVENNFPLHIKVSGSIEISPTLPR